MKKQKIICVDDDSLVLQGYASLLRSETVDLDCFESPKEALRQLRKNPQDYFMALVDHQMPMMDGGTFIKKIKKINPRLHCVLTSACASNKFNEFAKIAEQTEADTFLRKSDTNSLKMTVNDALENHLSKKVSSVSKVGKKQQIIKETLGLVGHSQALIQVAQKVKRFSNLNKAPVLITGETGVGKEQVARSIHDNSSRAKESFIPVNCGAITENLMEKIEATDHGTIFLDEIEAMPLNVQAEVHHFLEKGEIDLFGANIPQKVDVRVVATTNGDLKDAVKKGKFREDLYYRINILPIEIPPLRERSEDIGLLIQHFLKTLKEETAESKKITEKAVEKLKGRFWRGNVRELENTITRAFYFNDRLIIDHKVIGEVLDG